jgi:hypothetical protein
VLFTLITQHDSLPGAAIAALGAAVVIALRSLTRGRPKLLELGAVLAFAGFTVVAFSADPATSAWVARYARGIAAGALALTAFGSLLRTIHRAVRAGGAAPRVLELAAVQADQPAADGDVGVGVRRDDPVTPDRGLDRHASREHNLQLSRADRPDRGAKHTAKLSAGEGEAAR